MESASSANCGSRALIAGCTASPLFKLAANTCTSRMEDLELGRSGVVGLDEGRGREVDWRGPLESMVC